jgi:hypothetical protein
MTRSQSRDQFKFITDRFQNLRRTQDYSEYFVRSNSSLFSYQYQDAYSNYQPFYRQLNARQYDRSEYQNRDNRNSSSDSRYFKEKPSESASVLSFSKQSLQIISENNANASGSTFREAKSKNQRDYKNKERAYVTEKHEKKMKKSYNEKSDYYHESNSDLDYYNPQNQNDELEANFFTLTRTFRCRKCKIMFFSNNQLHKHLRQDICMKKSSIPQPKLEETTAHLTMNILIVEFTIDSFKNIDIDFGFRG